MEGIKENSSKLNFLDVTLSAFITMFIMSLLIMTFYSLDKNTLIIFGIDLVFYLLLLISYCYFFNKNFNLLGFFIDSSVIIIFFCSYHYLKSAKLNIVEVGFILVSHYLFYFCFKFFNHRSYS